MIFFGKVINGVPCVEYNNGTLRLPLKFHAKAREILLRRLKEKENADLANQEKYSTNPID